MAESASRNARISYAVGSRSTASRGRVFTDYPAPGGGRVRVIDRDVFDGAVRKSGELLAVFSRELKGLGKAADRAK